MKKDKATAKLASLTSNLAAISQESEIQLDTIRRVIGFNLRNNRQDISPDKLFVDEIEFDLPKEKILEFDQYAVNSLKPEDKFIVKKVLGKNIVPVLDMQMNDMRLPINIIDVNAASEWRWNQKADERMGPFNSQNGRPIWFDSYYFEDKLNVRSKNEGVPHFLFSKARRSVWSVGFRLNQTVELRAGHVWLLGKLFSSQATPNDYIGFNIKGGTFTIKNEKEWNGQYLDFQGGFSGSLTLQLVQSEKNPFDLEGCSAAQKIEFNYPDEVTFEWENGELKNVSAGQGKFKGYSNEFTFDALSLPLSYDNPLNHVFIPCQASPQMWKSDFSGSQLFTAEGEAAVQSSSWALPIVRVTNPTTLGEPENNGGWALRLGNEDIKMRWIGSDEYQPNAISTKSLVLLYPKSLLFYGDKSQVDITSSLAINQTFSCWNISSDKLQRVPLFLNYKDTFTFLYYCHASEGETLMAGCNGKIQPNRPVFADGSLSNLNDLTGWVIFQAKDADVKISTMLQDKNYAKKDNKPYALENALLIVSQAAGLNLTGSLYKENRNNIDAGTLTLTHGLLRWKPILPDPYVSNLQGGWGMQKVSESERATSALYAQVQWENPRNPIVTYQGDILLSSSIGIQPKSEPNIRPLSSSKISENQSGLINEHSINDKQKKEKNRLEQPFEDIEKSLSGWKLLDVSTNMDLIGVSVSPNLFGRQDNEMQMVAMVKTKPIQSKDFIIKNLAVHTPLSMVHVFTLPQVQWEPVRTLPEHQDLDKLGWFPENLSSASDGGPTRLISISQELSPIIPEVVVRQIKDEFSKGKQAIALTTLSFGLKARLVLNPYPVKEEKVIENGKEKIITPGRKPDSLDIVRPDFSNKKMKGGIQLNLMAESGTPFYKSPSPGFKGSMVQTLNGYELFKGTELGLSVLGATKQPDASVETQFNKEFAVGGSNPFVPVTRFDLSGYGGSNFSEWENSAALASIGQVQFKIMVGRTAFEIVKFVSKIYPWGITVSRSVTIERRSGGGIIRRDSGWQATQAGLLDFRLQDINPGQFLDNPFKFNPGVFRGCFDIKNIRPASNNVLRYDRNNTAKGFFKPEPNDIPKPTDIEEGKIIEIAPVYFDTIVEIDVQANYKINSHGVLGFIQLEPKPDKTTNPWTPRLLSDKELQKLIIQQGAIGGPIDNLLNIGNTGFNFRATRFEVDVADNAGTPYFVGVVRGQPVLPNNGSWSVVKMAAPSNIIDPQEATSADSSRGTPLFIENTWQVPLGDTMNVSPPSGPYRFADPSDLLVPNSPRFDYGFMQNTGSQAFLFRRPVIEKGIKHITSTLKPAFADPFALMTSKGVFPPIANAIEFPNNNFKLEIEDGKLKLDPPVENWGITRQPLSIAHDSSNQVIIEYNPIDTTNYTQSTLTYKLEGDIWEAKLDTFYVWTSVAGIDKLFGNRFSLRAGTKQQSKLVDVLSLMNTDIRDSLSFIPGFAQDQRVKDIELGMTNGKHETRIVAGYQCKIAVNLKSGKTKVKCLPGNPIAEIESLKNEIKDLKSRGEDTSEKEQKLKEKENELKFKNEYSTLEIKLKGGIAAGVSNDLKGDKSFALDVKLGASALAKIPIKGPVFLVLGLDVGLGLSFLPKFKWKAEIAAFVGVGAGFQLGPYPVQGYLAGGVKWRIESGALLWIGKLEAGIDFFVASVNINAEYQGYILGGSGTASGEVAVNVSIFLVFNISATYAYTETKKIG